MCKRKKICSNWQFSSYISVIYEWPYNSEVFLLLHERNWVFDFYLICRWCLSLFCSHQCFHRSSYFFSLPETKSHMSYLFPRPKTISNWFSMTKKPWNQLLDGFTTELMFPNKWGWSLYQDVLSIQEQSFPAHHGYCFIFCG